MTRQLGLARPPDRQARLVRRPRSRLWRVTAAILVASLAFGLWRLAGGIAGNPADLFPSAGAPPGSGSARIVISEFGIEADTLWMAPADRPSQRQVVAVVPHAAHYGIYATLSPDGRYIAYTALSPGLSDASSDSPAEVWVMGADGSYPRVLATDADLLIAPVWAPDSASLVFRRSQSWENAAGTFELVRVSLADSGQAAGGPAQSTLVTADAGLFPVSFSPDGKWLYYTQVSAAGTELGQVAAAGGAASLFAHLGDDFTRDWHLSPDGTRLAFLAPEQSEAGTVLRALVIPLNGTFQPRLALPAADRPAQDFNPIWDPKDGDLTLGRLTLGEAIAPAMRVGASGVEPLAGPSQGFDVPLAWSPDGGTLALRSFEGDLGSEIGPWHIVLLDAKGQRQEVKAESEISFVGWEARGK
jgi:Tol biopolymer transport system component